MEGEAAEFSRTWIGVWLTLSDFSLNVSCYANEQQACIHKLFLLHNTPFGFYRPLIKPEITQLRWMKEFWQ